MKPNSIIIMDFLDNLTLGFPWELGYDLGFKPQCELANILCSSIDILVTMTCEM